MTLEIHFSFYSILSLFEIKISISKRDLGQDKKKKKQSQEHN